MTIDLATEKTFTISEPVQVATTEVIVEQINDNYLEKKVVCVVKIGDKFVTLNLWENEEYDAIGQWTDTDVEARLTVLLEL